VRWAIVVGFALLAFVTGLAALLIYWTGQPGNILLLSIVAIGSGSIAFMFRRSLKRTTGV
jgi:hypothetical protein